MNIIDSVRNELITYVKTKYRAEPKNLWLRYLLHTAYRHMDNAKWFGQIMDAPALKHGLSEAVIKDIPICGANI